MIDPYQFLIVSDRCHQNFASLQYRSPFAMSDTNEIINQLSDKFEVSKQTEDVLFTHAALPADSSTTQSPQSQGSVVGVTTSVSTFVAQKNFQNFAVPHFASHWGVVCDFGRDSKVLFHLLFNPNTRKVIFDGTTWKDEWSRHSITYIGRSCYDFPRVNGIGTLSTLKIRSINYQIGTRLKKEFEKVGDYHVIFWNCQLFTKLFLRLICQEPKEINFDMWSASDVTRLVTTLQNMTNESLFVLLFFRVPSQLQNGIKRLNEPRHCWKRCCEMHTQPMTNY